MTSLLTFILIGVVLAAAQDKCPPGVDAYERLIKEYEAEETHWLKKYNDVKPAAADDVWETRAREWPGWAFIPRFLDLAEHDSASRDALFWVVNRSLNVGVGDHRIAPHMARALALLSGPHFREDERLVDACRQSLVYPALWSERYLREVLDRAKGQDLRGNACLS